MRWLLLAVAFAALLGCEDGKRGEYSATVPTRKSEQQAEEPKPPTSTPDDLPVNKNVAKAEPKPPTRPVQQPKTKVEKPVRNPNWNPPPETVEVDHLDPFDMKPGQAGKFGGTHARANTPPMFPPALEKGSAGAASAINRAMYGNQNQTAARVKILQIINTTQAFITVETAGETATFLLVNFPTKGLADGKYLDDQEYKVLGTVKMAGKTVYKVEPYTPKPNDEKIDATKLIGMWEPGDSTKDFRIVVEFAKDGKMSMYLDKNKKIEGTYKLEGNRLSLVLAEMSTLTILKLTDEVLRTQDSTGKKETLKRIKDKPEQQKVAPNVDPANQVSFQKEVLPVFRAKCLNCHGAVGKPKGDLDLRTLASIAKGGENGGAIKAGDLKNSLIWASIEDGAMPPADKTQLSEAEKTLIKNWILSGGK